MPRTRTVRSLAENSQSDRSATRNGKTLGIYVSNAEAARVEEERQAAGFDSTNRLLRDLLFGYLDGRDQLEGLRGELLDVVTHTIEGAVPLMSAAVSSKTEESVRAALSDTGRSERDARAKLQLKVENLSNTVVAEIEKIDAKFKAINDTLVAIQKALAAKGYDPGAIDGHIGSKTVSAMQKFEADNNLPQGQISIEAVKLLGVNLEHD